jgi:anti-anti-sigma regulatory factor
VSYVNWHVKKDVLVGTVSATHIRDDQSACRLTEDLKDGVSTHVLRGGAAASGADTKVLIDCVALQGATASLATRLGQLVETWHDMNIEFTLCDVPYEVLEAFETTGTDRLVKIYEHQRHALAAFRGQEVPTITTATAKKPKEKPARQAKPKEPRELTKVGQVIENLRAVAAIVIDGIGIKSRRQLQNSRAIQVAIPLLLLTGMIGGFLLWQSLPSSAHQIAPVSGTLRLDGQPLSEISVIFEPIGSEDNPFPGPSSYGLTNSLGQFTLTLVTNDRKGAVVGDHRVRLVTVIEEDDPAFNSFENQNLLPPQYNIETKLRYRVPPEGTQQALFDLKSEEPKEKGEEDQKEKEQQEEQEQEQEQETEQEVERKQE